ncbi:hypothetical protein lbkm_2295 [Lachnospiraceae bacterium KM106-2]|nr:hypothetical protein lbkm_2295 [Lachnospiraceae bacterium KM106-2]
MSKKKVRRFLMTVIAISVLLLCGSVSGIVGKVTTRKAQDVVDPKQVLPKTTLESDTTKVEVIKHKNRFKKYVFVGDSRYVGMSENAEDKDVFISKANMGYSYLMEQMTEIRKECDSKTALIIGLGVNDIKYSRKNYMNTINKMAKNMDCQIYYMLVNPVDEKKEKKKGYKIKNREIDDFNKKMQEGLSEKVTIIDTNTHLKDIGYETVDGLHYTENTYRDIYDYIKEQVDIEY